MLCLCVVYLPFLEFSLCLLWCSSIINKAALLRTIFWYWKSELELWNYLKRACVNCEALIHFLVRAQQSGWGVGATNYQTASLTFLRHIVCITFLHQPVGQHCFVSTSIWRTNHIACHAAFSKLYLALVCVEPSFYFEVNWVGDKENMEGACNLLPSHVHITIHPLSMPRTLRSSFLYPFELFNY